MLPMHRAGAYAIPASGAIHCRNVSVKQRVMQWLRHARLLESADAARFRWLARDSRASRDAFKRAFGDAPLPPDDIAYDAYGTLDWPFYWGFGKLSAEFLAPRVRAHGRGGRVLEWGCGPARIIRHLPDLLGPTWNVTGADANPRTIRWCTEHLPGIEFARNGETPPLPFDRAAFDCAYAVSVFTHLSADLQRDWARELRRVLKPCGLLICTLNGDASRALLMPSERAAFDRGEPVVRGEVKGGTRCYVAYHPPAFVRGDLLKGFEIVDHLPAPNAFGDRQDIWIAKSGIGDLGSVIG
jgi:SAM-dependent methyltransferase